MSARGLAAAACAFAFALGLLLGVLDPRPARAAAAPADASTVEALGVRVEALAREIEALAQAVESARDLARSLGETFRSTSGPAAIPSVDLLRRHPDQDLVRLSQLAEECARSESEASKRLRWTSQEEILGLYGRPSAILGEGRFWLYDDTRDRPTLKIEFVGDLVMNVMSY